MQWHSFLFHTYHFLSFKKANSHHGRPCKLDLQQNSTISFYSSYPNRKKSIQHFLLSLSGYCPNSFWKEYPGSSESKDGTHTDAAAVLTVPVTAHATIGLHVPVPCEGFRVLRRRPKPLTASKIILAVCGNFLHPCV